MEFHPSHSNCNILQTRLIRLTIQVGSQVACEVEKFSSCIRSSTTLNPSCSCTRSCCHVAIHPTLRSSPAAHHQQLISKTSPLLQCTQCFITSRNRLHVITRASPSSQSALSCRVVAWINAIHRIARTRFSVIFPRVLNKFGISSAARLFWSFAEVRLIAGLYETFHYSLASSGKCWSKLRGVKINFAI